MFATVQYDQSPTGTQAPLHQLLQRLLGMLDNPQGSRDSLDHELRPDRDQVDERPAGGKIVRAEARNYCG